VRVNDVPIGHIFRRTQDCRCLLRKVDDTCFVLVEFCNDHPSPEALNNALHEYERRFGSHRYRIADIKETVTYDPLAAMLEEQL